MYRTADHQQRACFLQVISPNNSALFLTKLPNLIQVSFSASILQLISVFSIFMNHTMPYNLSDLIWFPKASPNHGSPQPPAPRCQQAALASEETAFLVDISKFNSFRIPLKIPRFYSLITLHGHEKNAIRGLC